MYAWAGQFRTVNIAKEGEFYFAFANQIKPSVDGLLGQLGQEKQHLDGLNAEEFSNRAGHYLGELNAIHAFRDGNGRTQREFIRQLALESGYTLNWSRVSGEQMRKASRSSFRRGDNAGMVELVRTALVEFGQGRRLEPVASGAKARSRPCRISAPVAGSTVVRMPPSRITKIASR